MTAERRQDVEELLSALLDGELNETDRARAERTLREDESARRWFGELRQSQADLGALPRHAAPPTMLGDIRAHLERQALLESDDTAARTSSGRMRGWWWALTSAAAMVGLVALGTIWISMTWERDSSPRGSRWAVKDDIVDRATDAHSRGESVGPDADAEGARATRRSRRVDSDATGRVAGERLADASSASGRPGGPERPSAAEKSARERLENASSGARVVEGRLLELSDAERKLFVGLEPAVLAEHQFENESLRLVVRTASDRRRDTMARKLDSDLAALGATNVESGLAAGPLTSGRLFVRGKSGRNFAPGADPADEILVRIPGRELAELVQRISARTLASEDMVLISGPLVLRGSEAIQSTLRRRAALDRAAPLVPTVLGGEAPPPGQTRTADAEPAEPVAATPSDERSDRTIWPWGGLLSMIGVEEKTIPASESWQPLERSTSESSSKDVAAEPAAARIAEGRDGGSHAGADGSAAGGGTLVERRMEVIRSADPPSTLQPGVDDRFVTLVVRFESAERRPEEPAPTETRPPTSNAATAKPLK